MKQESDKNVSIKKTNRIKTYSDLQNKEHKWKKQKVPRQIFPVASIRLRYSRTAKVVTVKEEMTNLDSIIFLSQGGVREPRSTESELFKR